MKFIYVALLFLIISCSKSNCDKLNTDFTTYDAAIHSVRSCDFNTQEKINTDSSWIESIEYYSCDGNSGFLIIITTKGTNYIHDDVPDALWKKFKEAASFGSFYNNYVKGRYPLYLTH